MTSATRSVEKVYELQMENTYSNFEDYWASVYENIINLIRSLPPDLQSRVLYDIRLDNNHNLGNTICESSIFMCYDKNLKGGTSYQQFAYNTKDNSNTIRIPNRPLGIASKLKYSDTYSEPEYISDPFKMDLSRTGGLVMADEGVLTSFIEAAMKQNRIEKFEDGSLYCEILPCPGVWANEDTLQECVAELRQALELWLLLKIKDNDPLPILGGIDLNKIGSEFIEIDE